MPSTPTANLRLELQATGENDNTWGTKNNVNIQLLEEALTKRTTLTLSNSNVTLNTSNFASDQARSLCLVLTGTLLANVDVIVPSLSHLYLIQNQCTGTFNATVKTAAGTGVLCSKGATTIVYCDGTNVVEPQAGQPYPVTEAESLVGAVVTNFEIPNHEQIGFTNPRRYMTQAELDDVDAFTFLVNTTAAVQTAMDVSHEANCTCYVPAGGYLITTLDMPGAAAERDRCFTMRGDGVGEIFARAFNDATILKGTGADVPILRYVQDVPNTGNGNAFISGLRFEANSATAYAVDFEAFYIQSVFEHNAIFQSGNGGGMRVGLINGAIIRENYCVNADWLTNGLGLARTGIGYKIGDDLDTGLTKVFSNTSRGWLTGYEFGNGTQRMYSLHVWDNEVSVCYNGINLTASVQKAIIEGNYMEGGDGGYAILDNGDHNTIKNNLIFAGFGIGIDASNTSRYGTVIEGNVVSAGNVAGTKCILLGASGRAKTCRNNSIVFGASGGAVAGVVGLTLSGVSPIFDLSGNHFDPPHVWVGGAGTALLSDATTGNGVQGIRPVVHNTSSASYPMLAQGAMTLGKGATLGQADVAANVLTIGPQNYVVFAPTVPVTINAVTAQDATPAKVVIFRMTNANATFADTASLNMVGGAAYTPGANGGILQVLFDGGVGYEISRGNF